MSRTIDYWDSEGEERLTHTDIDEALQYILDGIDPLPEKIEICGYAHIVPNIESLATHALNSLLEGLDEDYGDPDGGYTEASIAMKEAAKEFLTAVLDEYDVWACDLVKRETVDVTTWVKENCPEWLELEPRQKQGEE